MGNYYLKFTLIIFQLLSYDILKKEKLKNEF